MASCLGGGIRQVVKIIKSWGGANLKIERNIKILYCKMIFSNEGYCQILFRKMKISIKKLDIAHLCYD